MVDADHQRLGTAVAEAVKGNKAAQLTLERYFATCSHEDARTLMHDVAGFAADGSRWALSQLIGAIDLHGAGRPAIRRIVTQADDVADIEQELLIRVARTIGGFRGEARFSTWLFRVATNTAIDHVRRRKESTPLSGQEGAEARRMSSLISTRQWIRHEIDQLPHEYRTPLMMREFDQLPYQEIAEQLDLNLNTVKSRIARGRAMIAGAIEHGDGGASNG